MQQLLPGNLRRVVGDMTIHTFGHFSFSSNNTSVVLTARKDLALLAYLANTPCESHRRTQLAALLWPQSDENRGRESLKQALLRLRRALPEGMVSTDRHTACLMLNRQHVDITRAEDQMSAATSVGMINVLDMGCDVFLAGLDDISSEFEEWRAARHQRLLDRIRRTVHDVLQTSVSTGSITETSELAQRALQFDPMDEEAARFLIQSYQATGRTREAIRVYEELKSCLLTELNVAPEPATQALLKTPCLSTNSTHRDQYAKTARIAILRFTAGEDASSQQFFAEGLADDITTDLSRNTALEVIPASSFSGLQGDFSHLLLTRGATHSLLCNVRQSNGRMRVNAQLAELREDQIVWAHRYDCAIDDVFDMQDAISSQVVKSLQLELSQNNSHTARQGTRNAHAYRMFHKGRSLYLRGINNHTLQAAKALLDRSIELDPDFARAYAQLAICESCLAMSIVNKTGEDYSRQVLDHAQVALKKNPDLALGHAAVGLAHYASGHYAEAESALLQAIELDENLFEAQFFQARNQRQQGDHTGAVQRFKRASRIRRNDFRSIGLQADAMMALGLTEDAHTAYRQTIERIETELEHHPDNAGALAFGAPILAELQRIDEAREWSAWALAIEPEDRLLRYNQARLFAMLGELDVALDHLEVAFHAPSLVQRRLALWMRHDRDFQPLQSNNRFKSLLRFSHRERAEP